MTLSKLQAFLLLLPALLCITAAKSNPPSPYRGLLAQSSQALVVTTPGWNSVNGTLRYFERKTKAWQQVGEELPVVVGKNGLAWDGAVPEVNPDALNPHLTKREGDGRSPAGAFRLRPLFGFSSTAPVTSMNYLPLTGQSECVDDANSSFYNQVIDRGRIAKPDWNSSEKMRAIDQYKLGVIVRYNPRNVKALGSCIFLHIWSGPNHGTAGCTAMNEAALRQIMQNLNARQNPILIQLPKAAYETLHGPWRLP